MVSATTVAALIVTAADAGTSPTLGCGQSSKLKDARNPAVFKTSDVPELEQCKQKQGCVFAAHPVLSQPRKTLPSNITGCRTQGGKCAEVAQS